MVNTKCIGLVLIALMAHKFLIAQSFVNGDLEGPVGYVTVPPGWDFVPYTDPICQATSTLEATVDVLDAAGPSYSGGIAGIPYSGSTFVSGLHAEDFFGGQLWHEGLMQTVSGFTIGENYTISLYQAVVKQNNCVDPGGSWRVYLDTNLIATTTVSISTLLPADVNLNWEERQVSFIATSTSHTIKFIPWDDDPNLFTNSFIDGGLRMGIDNVSFVTDPPVIDLGADTSLCVGQSLLLNASYAGSTYLWQDGSTDSTFLVTQSGTYWVTVTNSYGSDSDTISVNFQSPDQANLGPDMTICIDDSVVLSNATPSTSYLWSDNSTGPEILVSNPGVYWLQLTSYCGITVDTILIEEALCQFILEMPNVFTPNGDAVNDVFLPTEINYVDEYNFSVFNRWGNLMFHSEDQNDGWNGMANDQEAPEGVYTWRIHYQDLDGNKGEMHGFVHLFR